MNPFRSFLTAPVLAALVILPASASAQQPADTLQVDTLLVTAHRLAVPRARISSSITVLSGVDLRARGVTHVAEALRSVPGMHVVQSGSFGGTTSLFLRGGESDYVKVLVDGVPLNEPGGRADLANLTTDNIERIEVLRGPGSVLYGSDAVAGIVQIFTRDGGGRPRMSSAVRGGSHGSLAYDAEVSGEAGATRYAFAASRFTTDGIYDFNNQYRNGMVSGRLGLKPDDRTDASLTIRVSDSEFHYPTNGAGELVDRNAFQLEERVALGFEIGRHLSDHFEARLHLTTSTIDGGIDDQPDGPADTLGIFAYSSQDALRRRGIDARLHLRLSAVTILTAGIAREAQRQRSSNAYLAEWGGDSGAFAADRSNDALYLQAMTDLFGRLSVSAGARIDDNEAFGTFQTFRAGAVYRIDATGTRIRGSAGSAFREPTFTENFGAGFVTGNPTLRPERSHSRELGVDQALARGRIDLSATYFHQTFREMVQYLNQPWGSNEPNYFNVASASAAGWEFEMDADLGAGVTIETAYSHLDSAVRDAGFQSGPDAEFVLDGPLLRRPGHTASVGLAYRHAHLGRVEATLHSIGSRDDLDFAGWPATRVMLPAYTRVDIGGELDLLQPRGRRPAVAITARMDNVTDQKYTEIVHFPARGRTAFVGIRLGLGS